MISDSGLLFWATLYICQIYSTPVSTVVKRFSQRIESTKRTFVENWHLDVRFVKH